MMIIILIFPSQIENIDQFFFSVCYGYIFYVTLFIIIVDAIFLSVYFYWAKTFSATSNIYLAPYSKHCAVSKRAILNRLTILCLATEQWNLKYGSPRTK